MNLISPISPCPAANCEAPGTKQAVIGKEPDGCLQYECEECGVEWSWHLASTLCPSEKEGECHQAPAMASP